MIESIHTPGLPGKGDPTSLPSEPTSQFAHNIVVPIRRGRLLSLARVLARIDVEVTSEMSGAPLPTALLQFGPVRSLHFARWVIIPGDGGSRLEFTLHFDGPSGRRTSRMQALREHIADLVGKNRAGLEAVYVCCEGYPAGNPSAEEMVRYLLKPNPDIGQPTFFCGSLGRSRDQIRQEADLRARAARWLNDEIRAQRLPPNPSAIRQALLDQLGPIPPFPPQPDHKWVLAAAGLIVLGSYTALFYFCPLLAWSIAGAAVCLLIVLLVKEKRDQEFKPIYNAQERARVRKIAANENRFFQNALSNVVVVKPGRFRLWLLRAVLFSIQFLARTIFVYGRLGDIASIHFAHWYLLDNGRRLAFMSNFDSSWESYLGDFIDQASNGLTAIWSNTDGYPRTTALLFGGSRSGELFKAWARHIQVATQAWYSAYPDLSVVNIQDNTLIRRGLADEHAVPPAVWLAKLT